MVVLFCSVFGSKLSKGGMPITDIRLNNGYRDDIFVCILTLLEEMTVTQKNPREDATNHFTTVWQHWHHRTVSDVEIMEEKLANPKFMSELVYMLSLGQFRQFNIMSVVNLAVNLM